MKKDKKQKKERKKKVKAFKSVIQNIDTPHSKPYFATHFIPPTIRSSSEYSQPRFIPSFNSFDSFGLESQYPRVASDQFIIQLPQHRIEPTRLQHSDRQTFNMARDIVEQHAASQIPPQQPQPPPQLQVQQENQFVEPQPELIAPEKAKRPYKKKIKLKKEENV